MGISFARRPAGPGDLEFAYGLYRRLMEPLTAELRAWNESRHRAVVAEAIAGGGVEIFTIGAREVGWSEIREAGGALLLAQLYVEPAFQGRGIGTAVVSDLLARAGAARMPVDLSVLRNNGRARVLNERFGFRAVGEDGVKVHMRWG